MAQWRRTQCANCSEPRFRFPREARKNFLCLILKVMPQSPYGEPGVSVAWSHLGMRTGNSANEGDLLGSCWARGRVRYGMGVAAEISTFFVFFLFPPFLPFSPCLIHLLVFFFTFLHTFTCMVLHTLPAYHTIEKIDYK